MSTAASGKTQNKPAGSTGFEVPRAGGVCSVSGRPINVGEKYFAALRETPTGFERLDISHGHWEAFDKASLLGFWQSTMPAADQKKKVFVDDEVLCTLFERLADASEAAKLNFRFVLALVLMRKRLIIYEETRQEESRDVWVVRLKGREDRLDLIDPKLDETQVMDVSKQLGQILNEEL